MECARDILEFRLKKELFVMLGIAAVGTIVLLRTSGHARDTAYKKEAKPRRYMLVLVLIIYVCVAVYELLPILNDYRNNNIVCNEGIYVNRPNVSANMFGSPVEFTVNGETIDLETYCVDVVEFPDGEYSATAYYTENSKILLSLYDLKEVKEEN